MTNYSAISFFSNFFNNISNHNKTEISSLIFKLLEKSEDLDEELLLQSIKLFNQLI
jgi:hypothetical protein